jgi:hypothetical protein
MISGVHPTKAEIVPNVSPGAHEQRRESGVARSGAAGERVDEAELWQHLRREQGGQQPDVREDGAEHDRDEQAEEDELDLGLDDTVAVAAEEPGRDPR